MKVLHHVKELRQELNALRTKGQTVGLVPTMGALHQGHISLVQRCVKENDVTVVSIFVNPTQFNNPVDLQNYPCTLQADCDLLAKHHTTIAFVPSVTEMYPQADIRQFSYPPLDTVMEGVYRPGHFNGVCQIVSKLLDAVQPNAAYFGKKDFQQLAIVRKMVQHMGYNTQIVGCPIVREDNGLAMSSRNALLSPQEREKAINISRALFKSHNFAQTHNVEETLNMVKEQISAVSGLRLEYFEIVNGETLQTIHNWEDSPYVVGCITVYCGQIRLIDNIQYKPL